MQAISYHNIARVTGYFWKVKKNRSQNHRAGVSDERGEAACLTGSCLHCAWANGWARSLPSGLSDVPKKNVHALMPQDCLQQLTEGPERFFESLPGVPSSSEWREPAALHCGDTDCETVLC